MKANHDHPNQAMMMEFITVEHEAFFNVASHDTQVIIGEPSTESHVEGIDPALNEHLVLDSSKSEIDTDHSDEDVPEQLGAASLLVSLTVAAVSISAMARGGNFKVVRQNLSAQGKTNQKQPMSVEQKKLRRRKRKRK